MGPRKRCLGIPVCGVTFVVNLLQSLANAADLRRIAAKSAGNAMQIRITSFARNGGFGRKETQRLSQRNPSKPGKHCRRSGRFVAIEHSKVCRPMRIYRFPAPLKRLCSTYVRCLSKTGMACFCPCRWSNNPKTAIRGTSFKRKHTRRFYWLLLLVTLKPETH